MGWTNTSRPFLFCALWCGIYVCQVSSSNVFGQYRINSWTIETGLPQNSINGIIQTHDGYLWFTTFDGLVRYDGMRFTVFNKNNSPGLCSNRLVEIVEDREGNLWVGGETGGLSRYHDGIFVSYTTENGLPHNQILHLRKDRNDNAIIITYGGGLSWKNGKLISLSPAMAAELSDMFRIADSSGGVWYRDREKLYRLKDGNLTTYTTRNGLSSIALLACYEDRDGNLWFGDDNGALNKIRDGRITVYGKKDGLPPFIINAINEDSDGNLWVGTGGGLAQFKDGKFTIYTTTNGLSSNDINRLYTDREGNLWVGTRTNGLNRLRKNAITTYSEKDGLSNPIVYPIYEDRAGDIWLGTTAGLARLHHGKWNSFTGKDGLDYDNVSSITEDRQGRLWVGVLGGGYWFDNGQFIQFTNKIIPVPTTPSVIHQGNDGTVWLGTERGLYKYNAGNVSLLTVSDGLVSNEIKDIYEDAQGHLWIATYGGISCLSDDHFTNYTTKDGLAANTVRTIYQDAEGVFWFGTYDGGLIRFKDGRFTNYNTQIGLFDNGVFRILEDNRGNFWMSCNRGIFRVSKQQLNDFAGGKIASVTCVAYGQQDGMINAECNGGRQPAGIKTRAGKLWFPTFDGVAVVDPERIPINSQPPPVVIEELMLDGKPVKASPNGSLEIPPGSINLEIHYTGLSFVKSELMKFKYILEGLDTDWEDVGNRRTAYYPHLPSGQYRFTVIAANSDGVWNATGASLGIFIYPPFWRTWWFISAATAVVLGLTLLAYRNRIANLKQRHAQQAAFSRQLIESQERERKRIAAELHDSLSQTLSIIRNRAVLCLDKGIDHERTLDQVTEIADAASHALDEVREIAHDLRPIEVDRLGLTKAIQVMVKNVAESTQIRLIADLDDVDGLFSGDAEINLYRIAQESLNNIVKHSGATEATLRAKRRGRNVEIVIQDNGCGFSPESVAISSEHDAGFGLVGISERARILGGQLRVQSAPGQGTIITLEIVGT